jgi:23S rRNA pseudouridine1911/1915/1917 synthase
MRSKNSVTFAVLKDTSDYIAVDKPSGLLVIPGRPPEPEGSGTLVQQNSPDDKLTLQELVEKSISSKAWVVHRIDRGTSGVVLFAKNAQAHSYLCKQFEERLITKKYIALVSGRIAEDDGIINAPLVVTGAKVYTGSNGKESETQYKVIERFRDFSLIEAFPKTGRRHQIRVHMASMGHPLAVDADYGSRDGLYLSEFKKKYKSHGIEKPLLGRLSLHAHELEFKLSDGTTEHIIAPLPDDFEIALKQLRKHNHDN